MEDTLYLNKGGSTASYDLANSILNSLIKTDLKGSNNKVEVDTGLYILNTAKSPAVLVETGFITNEKDLRFLTENPDKVAKAISEGVINYYN